MLPDPSSNVDIHILNGGMFTLPKHFVIQTDDKSAKLDTPDWVFYIHQISINKHFLWDLGVHSDFSRYSPAALEKFELFQARGPKVSLTAQLEELGVPANSIDGIIFSHAHALVTLLI